MKRLFYFLVIVLAFSGLASAQVDYENNPKLEEISRIKILNQAGGSIEVSSNAGKSWQIIGRVIYPTIKTNAASYKAARWIPDGRVAATSVNAIHLKTATSSVDGSGVIFSLLPAEFLKTAKARRSYLSPDSSIYTDLLAGETIFGGSFSPFVGNRLLVSRSTEPVLPLPNNYKPQLGDKIYIIVERPIDYPRDLVFENKFGGKITIDYFNGSEKVIGRVLRPVVGVGRFEGSKFSGVGRVRANHAGVIDVSTSRLGKVGGFQIVPAEHGSNLGYVRTSTQWMVIGADEPLEGKAPFFKYFIRPVYGKGDLETEDWESKLLQRFLVEVKLKGSDHWQSMPVLEFDDYYLSGELPVWANDALKEITYIRLLFPLDVEK